MALSKLLVSLLLCARLAAAGKVSTFAGATTTFLFPPDGVTATIPDPNFPDATHVGSPGRTATGDEAAAMATAPVLGPNHNQFPLVSPIAADAKDEHEFNVIRYFGNLSPWRSIPSANYGLERASPTIPKGCEIVQAHLLHRHGARYPTQDAGVDQFADKIHKTANSAHGFNATGDLEFLQTWKYKLGGELLTPFGRSELFDLGVGFRIRYGSLLKGFNDLPVFRTTSQARMVDSALNFAAGFFGLPDYDKNYHQFIEVEAEKKNITLASYNSCPNAMNGTIMGPAFNKAAGEWKKIYLKQACRRLQGDLSGFDLTVEDCFRMQHMCAFETVALGYSEFCGLFTQEEWEGYSYANSLSVWYGAGPGNPMAAALGIGWVQELVSRLNKTRITEFNTSVNKAVVRNETLFPFGQPIYVDASHDITMASIYVAMNFTNFIRSGPLPSDYIPYQLSYKTDEVMPFAVNLVGQVLSCPAPGHKKPSGEPTHIRWVLNDGVLPLSGIKGCESNGHGMCEFDTFVSAMKQRIKEVDYHCACFEKHTFPDPDYIMDGQWPECKRH